MFILLMKISGENFYSYAGVWKHMNTIISLSNKLTHLFLVPSTIDSIFYNDPIF